MIIYSFAYECLRIIFFFISLFTFIASSSLFPLVLSLIFFSSLLRPLLSVFYILSFRIPVWIFHIVFPSDWPNPHILVLLPFFFLVRTIISLYIFFWRQVTCNANGLCLPVHLSHTWHAMAPRQICRPLKITLTTCAHLSRTQLLARCAQKPGL